MTYMCENGRSKRLATPLSVPRLQQNDGGLSLLVSGRFSADGKQKTPCVVCTKTKTKKKRPGSSLRIFFINIYDVCAQT